MKILLTGGSGLLGAELCSLYKDIVAPPRNAMDILNEKQCENHIVKYDPDIVVHAAALISPPKCDKFPEVVRNINIVGTVNVVNICQRYDKKIVYISSDYVFDGEKGNYKEKDFVNPLHSYGLTKAAGEFAVRTYDNSLIIRTSFCKKQFPYEKAFVDQYTSKDYIDVIAPMILETILSSKTGIVHIGTERKTIYELAKRRKPDVGKLKRDEVDLVIPYDTSFY